MNMNEIRKQATDLQIQKLSSLITLSKKLGNSGEILFAQFSEHGVLGVGYEGIGGSYQFVMIGKRGAEVK